MAERWAREERRQCDDERLEWLECADEILETGNPAQRRSREFAGV